MANPSKRPVRRIWIVITSLSAEGTPVLALALLRQWELAGIEVQIATLSPEPTDLLAEFSREGQSPACLHISQGKILKFVQLFYRSYKLCKTFKPDAVVCFPFGWHSFIGWGARLAGVRRTVTHAGNYPPDGARPRQKMAATIKIGNALGPKIIACSEYVADGVREHLAVPAPSVEVVYNGISVAAFNVPRQAPFNTLRIGMVARLEMHKDQPTLIRAAKLLVDSGLPVRVELVGEGSRRREYEELIQTLGLADHVKLLGMRRDIPDLLSSWNLFVFSARADEGLGIALIEALAVGVPVIGTDVGACREVIGKLGTGMAALVQPGSPEAIAAAVKTFHENRQTWNERASQAKTLARREFSIEAMSTQYLRIIGEAGA
jgi:glycosyltransferase involved in cell wall biosynthesis